MTTKKANKAAVYSALVFPGAGLVWLKHYKRAAIFIIPSLAALWHLCSVLYSTIVPIRAKIMADAEEGVLVIDPTNMGALYMQLHHEIYQGIAAHQSQLHVTLAILIAAWVCSIASSYSVGKKLDLESEKENTNV